MVSGLTKWNKLQIGSLGTDQSPLMGSFNESQSSCNSVVCDVLIVAIHRAPQPARAMILNLKVFVHSPSVFPPNVGPTVLPHNSLEVPRAMSGGYPSFGPPERNHFALAGLQTELRCGRWP